MRRAGPPRAATAHSSWIRKRRQLNKFKSIDYVGTGRPLPRATPAYPYVMKASLAHPERIVDISKIDRNAAVHRRGKLGRGQGSKFVPFGDQYKGV
jgi:hypothetical protein